MAQPGESTHGKPRTRSPLADRTPRASTLSAGRIAVGYAIIAILWIAFSDAAVTYFKLNPFVMTMKGTVFVVVTAALLYGTVRRLVWFVRLSSQERDQTAQLYQTLIEASHEGICLLDESGRISFLNGRLAAMLDRPAEELQGKRLQDFIDEPFVLAEPAAQQSEIRECRLRKDSDPKPWVVISRHPVLNDAGEVVKLVVTVTDITQGKRVEQALGRSEAYRPAFPAAHQELRESPLAVRYGLTVVSVAIALGTALVLQNLHFRAAPIPLLLLAVAISSWYGGKGPAVLASILSMIGFYWYFVEPVQTIHIYWSNVPFFLIFSVFAVLISWFATVRQRFEAGLQQQAALLNLTHDAVFVMDIEGVIKFWNRGAEERYGWPAEKAVGKVVHDLLKTVLPRPLEEIKTELIRTGRWEAELVHTRKDGTQLAVMSRWSLQRDRHGAPVAILETNNDISERKRAEEALSRLNRQLRAISNCNQALLRATDEQSLLQEICRIVCEDADYRMAWVGYAEHDQCKSVRPVAWTGIDEEHLAKLAITWADKERGQGPSGTAIRTGKTCCIQDFATDPGMALWREGGLLRDFGSAIALPLKDENANTFGSLGIYSAQSNSFTAEEVGLLEELAADLAFGVITLRSRALRKQAEEALRESESYLREGQALTHTGSWAFDVASQKHVYLSEECFRIFGFDPQGDLPTRKMVELRLHPEDSERVIQSFEKVIQDAINNTDEFRIVLPNGTSRHVHVLRHPVRNAAGDVVKVVGTAVDVTERKQAEDELRESEMRFRTFVDHAADAFAIFDEQHRVIDVNREACERTGYTREEVIGLVPQDFDPDVDAAMLRRIDERLEAGETFTFETRNRRKDGTVFPVEVRIRLFCYGGRRLHLAVSRDISERKRGEEALRRSEGYLAEAQRLAHTGSWALDVATGEYAYWSAEMFRIFAFDPQLGLPKVGDVLKRIDPDERADIERAIRTSFLQKDTEFEFKLIPPDGIVKQIHCLTHPVLDPKGKVVEVVGTIVDITERTRAEQERERLRELEADLAHMNRVSLMGELAASIAHEVNQPLSGVVNNGSACLRWLAADTPNLDEARESARRIVRDGKRAGEVVARIRAMASKAAAPKAELDLNQTIREVLSLVREEAARRNVTIQREITENLAHVTGDQVQLQQVLLNLLMNGIEAMSNVGDRERRLVISTRDLDAGQVEVTLEDSGGGIDPSVMQRVFEPFYTTKEGGMGMGLAVCRSIIQSHGGRLWATTNEGPGTTFHFTLPKYQEHAQAVAV